MSSAATDSKPTSRLGALGRLLSSPPDSWLAFRILGWVSVLPLLKRTLPLPRLVRLMSLPARGSDRDPEREHRTITIVARLSGAAGGNCLERSLILYRYLGRAGADPRLIVGLAKADTYLGHVWVTVDGHPILENPETLLAYSDVIKFDSAGMEQM